MKIIPLIVMVGMLIACSDSKFPAGGVHPGNEKTLHFDVYAPIGTLDPSVFPTSSANLIFPLLYSYLCVPDHSNNLVPDLAEKWYYDASDYTWKIFLNPNALFHNGQAVTSVDVESSLRRYAEPRKVTDLYAIKSISIVSDSTLEIKLTNNDPQFLRKIWEVEILPASADSKVDYYNHPIGSGPFQFVSRSGKNEVVLRAFKDHFCGRPAIDYIIYHFQPIKEKSWTRLLAGDTDIIMEISPKNFKILQNYPERYYFHQVTLHAYTILLYNNSFPLFSDPTVRTALTYGIDREYIVREILNGAGVVAHGPMGVDSIYHNPGVKPLPYNPKKAVALLKQAGWRRKNNTGYFEKNGKIFEFTLLVFQESQIEKKVARYIQLCLNEIGVRVRTKELPFDELMGRYCRNTQFEAVLTELKGVYRNPIIALNLWAPTETTPAIAGCFHHPVVTELVPKVLKERNLAHQIPIYRQIDTLLTDLQPGSFLYQKKAIDVMSKRFSLSSPFSLTLDGVHKLQFAHLKNSKY